MANQRPNPQTPHTNRVPPLGGEGDKQADRNYREGVRRSVQQGDIEAKAEEAKDAQDDETSRAEGLAAEQAGRARSKGEDPRLEKERQQAERMKKH